jgi:phosphoglycolate phosphatase-like HAD superfamily hydrolase
MTIPTQPMYDCLAWDFDGVLVDSRAEAWRAASEIMALLGVAVDIKSQATFRKYFTASPSQDSGDTEVLRAMHRLVMRSRAHLLQLLPCFELIPRLCVETQIVTSGSRAVVRTVLGDRAGLFTAIRGREEGPKDELLGALSSHAICVTDTTTDIGKCRQRSLAVIAVSWGYDTIADLQRAEPDHLVTTTAELQDLFVRLGLLSD